MKLFTLVAIALLLVGCYIAHAKSQIKWDDEFEEKDIPLTPKQPTEGEYLTDIEEEEETIHDTLAQPIANNEELVKQIEQLKVITFEELGVLGTIQFYALEIGYVVVLVSYGINYFIGRKANEHIASQWARNYRDIFATQFAQVGLDALLVKESAHAFRMQAYGRVHCHGLQANLRLKRRQDLISMLYSLYSPSKDIIEISVALTEQGMDPFLFAIMNSREERSYVKDNEDLKLAKNMNFSKLSDKWAVLTDSRGMYIGVQIFKLTDFDGVEALMTNSICHLINSNANTIMRSLHVTDTYSNEQYKCAIRLICKLPETEPEGQIFKQLLDVIFHLIDEVPKVKLSATNRAANEKARRKLRDKELKEEREKHQEKLQQDKQQKLEEKLAAMTPEKREKYEEKMRLKEKTKRLKGRIQVAK